MAPGSDMPDQVDSRPMLTSWKAIAAFFDRDVRTVQRWETEGLPVRRHLHRRQSSVYAYPAELEAWWIQRGQLLIDVEPQTVDVSEAAPSVAARIESDPPRFARWAALAIGVVALAVTGVWGLGDATARRSAVTGPKPELLADLDHPAPLAPGPVGDFDGNGAPDFTVYSQEAGVAFIVSAGAAPVRGDLTARATVRIETTDNTLLLVPAARDFDADGVPDLLLTTLARAPETFRRTGAAYLLRGRQTWPKVIKLPADADVRFSYAVQQDIRMGGCTSDRPMDLNGDGMEDIVLGAPDYSPFSRASAGGVFVFFGRRTWPREMDVETDADVTLAGAQSGEGLGPFCEMGDFNGDRRADLALGATETTLWALRQGRGKYYVILGPDRWPRSIDTAHDATVRVDGERPHSETARPLLGDVNGDGLDDLVMAATRTTAAPGGSAEIVVLFGRTGPFPLVRARSFADVLIDGGMAVPKFGPAVAVLDIDADGSGDQLITEPATGRVLALFGRHTWPAKAAIGDVGLVELLRGAIGQGADGMRTGDVDGDSTPDLILTAPSRAFGGTTAGGHLRAQAMHQVLPIDVRPGAEPNILYLPGILVVRVNGSHLRQLDPLDLTTVRLAGIAPHRTLWNDADDDRVLDLHLYFETARMRVTEKTTSVVLTARTHRGTLLRGTDSVVVLPGPKVSISDRGEVR